MTFDFPLILTALMVFTGVVSLVDIIYLAIRRRVCPNCPRRKEPLAIEYARAFFPVFLIVLLLRSFVAQPYRVPTGSLSPTVLPGDLIFVTQYNYGVKWPVWNATLKKTGSPQRGQIGLFYYPVNHDLTFVKRVVGMPGDTISYINKTFYINGKEQTQTYLGSAIDSNGYGAGWPVKVYRENLDGVEHKIYINPKRPGQDFYNLKIPQGQYLMIGDNRDNSDDSRSWGVVPESAFIGRARLIWMSWDSQQSLFNKIRWGRIGQGLSDKKDD